MEWNLEDLFAEPPPKIGDDCENSFSVKLVDNICRTSIEKKAIQDYASQCQVKSDVSVILESGNFKFSNNLDVINTRSDESHAINGNSSNHCTKESSNDLQSTEERNPMNLKKYHIPKLDDILKLSATANSKGKLNGVCEDRVTDVNAKETYGSNIESHYISGRQSVSTVSNISEDFKRQFGTKDVTKTCMDSNFSVKRKFEEITSIGITTALNCPSLNEAIPSRNQIQETGESLSKKKKAGNYRRKLHSKCRISAKEIRKLPNNSVRYDDEFFAEAPERSVTLQRPDETVLKRFAGLNNAVPIGQNCTKFRDQKKVNMNSKKQKIKRKNKAKKKKGKLANVNMNKQEINITSDNNNDDDELVLSPRKDLKPHKWPVCKKRSETDVTVRTSQNTKLSSQQLGMGKNLLSNEEVKLKEKSFVKNSVLDTILSETISFYGKKNSDDIALRNSSQCVLSSTKAKNGAFHNNNLLLWKSSPGLMTSKNGMISETCKTEKLSKIVEMTGRGSLGKSQNLLEKEGLDISTGFSNMGRFSKSALLNCADSSKDEVGLRIVSCETEVDNKGCSERGKKEQEACKNEMNGIDDESNEKTRNIEDNDNGNGNNCGIRNDCNVKLCATDNGSFELPSCAFKKEIIAEDINGKVQGSKGRFVKIEADSSFLTNVFNLPVDLSVAGKEEHPKSVGKQKRGGRKKKGKKRKANEHQKPRNLRVDTEAKVQCKYFLDGKCNKGTECRFLHEGIPRRRELCRYYVTDCCLAENCIFMHGEFPCKFFHAYSKCANGRNCKYSHDPLTEETKRLLHELLSRDASMKKEALANDKDPAPASNEVIEEETVNDSEASSKLPSLYSSLI